MCNKSNTPEIITNTINTIVAGIPDAKVDISDLRGDNNHLQIEVTSNAFIGLRLIKQHQMIMDLLRESLKSELHAVIIKTKTY
jgi:stress-induced morphogen